MPVSAEKTKAKVAIVGGGYLGSELAKALESDMDVTLVERAQAFTHAPAMIRAMVDQTILEKALIPYDKLLTKGRFVQAEVTSVAGNAVGLADGTLVEADYVILATGSGNMAPFKSNSGDIDALRASSLQWHSALCIANSIAIIGAGAVGTELAGEIASAMPTKKVTLISSDTSLFPGFPPKLAQSLHEKLSDMGVDVVPGERAQDLPNGDAPTGGTITLSSGRTLDVDLIVPAVGARVNGSLIDMLPDAKRWPDGRVQTDAWMRPSSLPNVFAAGDIADNGDLMTIVAVSRQVPWLSQTLKAAAAGRRVEAQKPYKPWNKAPILLPLGPKRGSSFLMIATFGDWITRSIKGRDLFITKYRKIFGVA